MKTYSVYAPDYPEFERAIMTRDTSFNARVEFARKYGIGATDVVAVVAAVQNTTQLAEKFARGQIVAKTGFVPGPQVGLFQIVPGEFDQVVATFVNAEAFEAVMKTEVVAFNNAQSAKRGEKVNA
jgi:hypothetical protein